MPTLLCVGETVVMQMALGLALMELSDRLLINAEQNRIQNEEGLGQGKSRLLELCIISKLSW